MSLRDATVAQELAKVLHSAMKSHEPGSGDTPTAMIRYGKVTVVTPFTISLGADPTGQTAKRLASYSTPVAGDIVAVLQPTEGQLLVLGKVV